MITDYNIEEDEEYLKFIKENDMYTVEELKKLSKEELIEAVRCAQHTLYLYIEDTKEIDC